MTIAETFANTGTSEENDINPLHVEMGRKGGPHADARAQLAVHYKKSTKAREQLYPDDSQYPLDKLEYVSVVRRNQEPLNHLFLASLAEPADEENVMMAVDLKGKQYPCHRQGDIWYVSRYSVPYKVNRFVAKESKYAQHILYFVKSSDLFGEQDQMLAASRKTGEEEVAREERINAIRFEQLQAENCLPMDGSNIRIAEEKYSITMDRPIIKNPEAENRDTPRYIIKSDPDVYQFLSAIGVEQETIQALEGVGNPNEDSFNPNKFFEKYDLPQNEAPIAVNILNRYRAAVRSMYQKYPRIEFQGWTEDMVYLTARTEEETATDAGYICEVLNTEGESLRYMMTLSGKLFPIATQKRGAKIIMNCVSEPYVLERKRVRKVLFRPEIPAENNAAYFVDLNGNASQVEDVIIAAMAFHPIRIVADGPDHLSEIITEHLSELFRVSSHKKGQKKVDISRWFKKI